MEQHYIIIFQIVGNSKGNRFYTTTIIVEEYPGKPDVLLLSLMNKISDDSVRNFGFFIEPSSIVFTNLTRVY